MGGAAVAEALLAELQPLGVPADLDAALDDDARTFFHGLAPSHRKEWVRWVEEAKKPETRAARVEKTAEALRAGRKTR